MALNLTWLSLRMKVTCVIPAFNEEKTVQKVVERAKLYVNEVIVVDDGSSDRTAEVAELAGAEVIRHLVNKGKGAAASSAQIRSQRPLRKRRMPPSKAKLQMATVISKRR